MGFVLSPLLLDKTNYMKNMKKLSILALLFSALSLCAQEATVYDGADGSAFPWLPSNSTGQINANGGDCVYENYNQANGNPIVASHESDPWFIRNDGSNGGSLSFRNCYIDLMTNGKGTIFNNSSGDFELNFDSTEILMGSSNGSFTMAWNDRSSNFKVNFTNGSKAGVSPSTGRFTVNSYASYNNLGFLSGSAEINISGTSSATTEIGFWDVNLYSSTDSASTYKNAINISGYSNVAIHNTNIGTSAAAGSTTSTLKIEGGNCEVKIDGNLNIAGSSLGTSAEKPVGGILEFVADDYGVSTLDVAKVSDFSGVLSLDFSSIKLEAEQLYEFVLISATSDWTEIGNELLSSDRVLMKTANAADEWELYMAGNMLVLNYTAAVPEPSAIALVFGLFAFAFAAFRGRR